MVAIKIMWMVIGTVIGIVFIGAYVTHLSMTITYRKEGKIKWIHWFKFYKIFKEKDWRWSTKFPHSFFEDWQIVFNREGKEYNEIHAYIIRFDSASYFFDPVSFVIFTLWSFFIERYLVKKFPSVTFNDNFIINWGSKFFTLKDK